MSCQTYYVTIQIPVVLSAIQMLFDIRTINDQMNF